MRTGQIEIDVLLAALVLSAIFLLSSALQCALVDTYITYSRYHMLLLDALRFSDFLLYSPNGLAVAHSGLTLDHVVDCSKLPRAYAFLRERGFEGYVVCGPYAEGEGEADFVIRRKAVQMLAGTPVPVVVEVGVRVPHG